MRSTLPDAGEYMSIRFYNPGSRIYEKMAFDHPTNDIKSMNLVSYYTIDVGAKELFDVPTEVPVDAESGEQYVSVKFADRIQKDFKPLAVIRINPKAKDINEDDNVAANESDAKKKGEILWREAMLQLVRDHKRSCDEARHAGLTPARARGTIAHALKTLGIEDPANDVADVLSRRQDQSEVSLLKSELADMQKMLLNLASKGK